MNLFSGEQFNILSLSIAVAAVIIGALAAYYARRALFPPKRRLTIYALPPASLLAEESASTAGLEVTYQGSPLRQPYLSTISVENSGRHAVGSSQFDKSRPIAIDLGQPIKAVLKSSVLPDSTERYEYTFSGSILSLGPDLLNPGQSLIIQVLTDGRPSTDDLRKRVAFYLGETRVDFRDNRPAVRDITRSARVSTLVGGVAGVLALALTITVTLINAFSGGLSVSISPDNGPVGTQVVLTGGGAERFAIETATIQKTSFSVTPSASATPSGSPKVPSSAAGVATISPSPTDPPNYSDDVEIARTQADGSGRFRMIFNIPNGLSRGAVRISITSSESGGSQFSSVDYFVR